MGEAGRLTRVGRERNDMSETGSGGALEGIRVVEMGQLIAGPFCGQLLGDMGAEIVKLEPPVTGDQMRNWGQGDKPSWRSEEHTSELQSLMRISYAVFCLKKKKNTSQINLTLSIDNKTRQQTYITLTLYRTSKQKSNKPT